jgi:hypothetical protein
MKANLGVLVVVLVVFGACGLAACTTQEARPDSGSPGAGGSSAAGTGGGAGTTGTGGLAAVEGVTCPPPEQMLNNFTFDPDGGSMTDPRFGTFGTTLSGGGSAYGGLTSDVTGNDWHLVGTISDYSGFGLYFDNCNKINASDYAGIRFTIWGTFPSPNQLVFSVPTMSNSVPGTWLQSVGGVNVTGNEPGRCFPGANMMQYYHPDCADPIYKITVTGTQAAPQTVSLMWNGFMEGKPQPAVMPSEITGILWYVTWTGASGTPYMVDFHIDNLAFIPK